MGNNFSTGSADVAMEYFLLREQEDLLLVRKGQHHKVLFVPDTFLFKELTEKVKCGCEQENLDQFNNNSFSPHQHHAIPSKSPSSKSKLYKVFWWIFHLKLVTQLRMKSKRCNSDKAV